MFIKLKETMIKKLGSRLAFKDYLLFLLFGYMLFRSATVGISLYVLIFSISVFFFASRNVRMDRMAVYLGLFSLSYAFISFVQASFEPHQLVYLVAPVAFYYWGQHVMGLCKSEKNYFLFLLLFLLLFAVNTYYLTITDILEVGLINPYRGMLREGDSDVVMPATLFGLNVSLGLSGLAIFLSQTKETRSKGSYLFLVVLALSLLTTVHLINRTGIVVFFVCTLVVFLNSLTSKKNSGIYLIGLLLFMVLLYLAFSNYFSFGSEALDAYNMREQSESGGLSDFGNRGWRWADAIKRVFTNPFGWSGIDYYNFAHNLWLDVAMLCGIVPFTFLLLATVLSFNHLLKLRKIKKDSIVSSFIALNVCFFLASFVEPVMVGYDVFFYLYCMLWGMQKAYFQKSFLARP